ncbi:MAG TPA: hypothetical protein VI137_05105, partial [Pseudolabrys sp.]
VSARYGKIYAPLPIFERFRDLQILDLEPQDRLDAPERLPAPRPTQNLQLTGPMQRPVVLASCKPAIQTVRCKELR